MLGILAGMDQKDYCSGMYKAGIYGEYAPRALFSSLVGRPRMLVILALMDQKDSWLKEYMFPYTAQCLDFVLHVMRQLTDAFGENFPHFLDESGPERFPIVLTQWPTSLLCGSCWLSGASVEKTFVLPQLQIVSSLSWRRGGFPWSKLFSGP